MNELKITPSSTVCRDKDGNIYSTVVIGNQEWMAEDLKTTHFQNGDYIFESGLYSGEYGYFYNDASAYDSRGVCPDGFHTPNQNDWEILEEFLNPDEGCKMKDTENWEPSESAINTNESGFTAQPSGYQTPQGIHHAIGSLVYYNYAPGSGVELQHNDCQLEFYQNICGDCYWPIRCVAD